MSCKLNRCCCCGCTLQTGTKAIGFLSLLGEVIALYLISMQISSLEGQYGGNAGVLAIPVVNVFSTVGFIGCTFLLLHAAFQDDKPLFLVPWLTVGALSSIFGLGVVFFSGVVFIQVGAVALGISHIVGGFLMGAINTYFWLIVYSYFHELKDNAHRQFDYKA